MKYVIQNEFSSIMIFSEVELFILLSPSNDPISPKNNFVKISEKIFYSPKNDRLFSESKMVIFVQRKIRKQCFESVTLMELQLDSFDIEVLEFLKYLS